MLFCFVVQLGISIAAISLAGVVGVQTLAHVLQACTAVSLKLYSDWLAMHVFAVALDVSHYLV